MMTNGPEATVGEILEVDLPRPRDRLLMVDDPEYGRCRAEVLRFLYDKQRKVESLDSTKHSKKPGGRAKSRAA